MLHHCPSPNQIRDKMIGPTKANYSEYTCYTGISDFTPADIDVGAPLLPERRAAFQRCAVMMRAY